MTRNQKADENYNGFAFPLQPDTDLGLAINAVRRDLSRICPAFIFRIARYPPAASQIATARTSLSFIGAPEPDHLS